MAKEIRTSKMTVYGDKAISRTPLQKSLCISYKSMRFQRCEGQLAGVADGAAQLVEQVVCLLLRLARWLRQRLPHLPREINLLGRK